MIDLIIPYYNNPEGLIRTLESIDQNIFYITIIDDHSEKAIPYSPKANQIFRQNDNQGPGCARQLGIERTNNPYIIFIDTGDVFLSKEVQKEILMTIQQNPEVNIFSWQYYYGDKITNHHDNRTLGRVYKREFLDKYGITFCAESSYMNEDIGFNHTCNIISNAINIPIMNIDIPIMRWIFEPNSITQSNNGIVVYTKQTRALSLVSLHAINICKKNNIDVQEEIDFICTALYYWFIKTIAEKKEYAQVAWDGVKIFYDTLREQIKPENLVESNVYLKKTLLYRNKISFPVNILRFTRDIWDNKIVPDRYLTFQQI